MYNRSYFPDINERIPSPPWLVTRGGKPITKKPCPFGWKQPHNDLPRNEWGPPVHRPKGHSGVIVSAKCYCIGNSAQLCTLWHHTFVLWLITNPTEYTCPMGPRNAAHHIFMSASAESGGLGTFPRRLTAEMCQNAATIHRGGSGDGVTQDRNWLLFLLRRHLSAKRRQ